MQFDWTTFTLEIVNFLVLLWILTRFLYRPVLANIDARRAALQQQEDAVQARQRDADAAKARYDALVDEWNGQREQARHQLDEELARQRAAGMDAIRRELGAEHEKAAARAAAAAAMREAEQARHAAETAYGQASAMLRRLAWPGLTERIADVFLEDLQGLPAPDRAALAAAAAALADDGATVEIAHPADAETGARLAHALSDVAGRPLAPRFAVRPDLIAGMRVAFGEYLLKADLADELRFFQERDAHA
jgi:F-type H+-transporting ATPase subunit b